MKLFKNFANRLWIHLDSRQSLLFIILSGFTLRIIWWAYAQPVPVSDFETYRLLAQGILEHGQFGVPAPTAYRLPGYPSFLALLIAINESTAWLGFVSVILSTALIYFVYQLAFQLTLERPISGIASLICSLNPTFIFFSPVLASEHLSILLLVSVFLVLILEKSKQPSLRAGRLILAGLLFGAAVLTRADNLFYLPVVLGASYLSLKEVSGKKTLVLIPLLSFTMVIAPWYIRNYHVIGPGSGLSTSGGVNFYYAHNGNHYGWHSIEGSLLEEKNEAEQQKILYRLGFEYLARADIFDILKDLALGTAQLYLYPGTYSVHWSTRLPNIEPDMPFPAKSLSGIQPLKWVTLLYLPILLLSILSWIFFKKYLFKTWFCLYGLVFMNWVGYAWIFWGKARYRFVSEVAFCILASFIVHYLLKKHVLPMIRLDESRTS